MNKVLIISPHPDDETLGAGGTLLRHKERGDYLYWCNITDMKEEYGFSKEAVRNRQEEIERVINAYNFEYFFNLKLKPARLTESDVPMLIEKLSEIINKIKPEIMYIPFFADAHSDHRIVFQSLQPFSKSFRYPFIRRILLMEIISETDGQFIDIFRPNVFVDISDFIEKKLKIISLYKTETRDHPFPRNLENIKNFAFYRGSQCNCMFAESFMLLKEVW